MIRLTSARTLDRVKICRGASLIRFGRIDLARAQLDVADDGFRLEPLRAGYADLLDDCRFRWSRRRGRLGRRSRGRSGSGSLGHVLRHCGARGPGQNGAAQKSRGELGVCDRLGPTAHVPSTYPARRSRCRRSGQPVPAVASSGSAVRSVERLHEQRPLPHVGQAFKRTSRKCAAAAFLIPAPANRSGTTPPAYPPNSDSEATSLMVTNSISASTKARPVRNAHS